MFIKQLLTIICICIPIFLLGQYNTLVSAEILIDDNTEYATLRAKATNVTEVTQDLRFVFSVFKKNKTDSIASVTKKENPFTLDSFKSIFLTETTINKSDQEEFIVVFLVYNSDNVLLGKARWSQNEEEVKTPVVISKEEFQEIIYDDVFLKGIVTEDTRTKPGRDFYKMLYSKYDFDGINADEIVSVKELVAGRLNTLIEVRLGDVLVSKFFLQPSEEFLKKMVTFTLTRIRMTIQNKKNINQQIERY